MFPAVLHTWVSTEKNKLTGTEGREKTSRNLFYGNSVGVAWVLSISQFQFKCPWQFPVWRQFGLNSACGISSGPVSFSPATSCEVLSPKKKKIPEYLGRSPGGRSFVCSQRDEPAKVPGGLTWIWRECWSFWFSTFWLISSSYFLKRAVKLEISIGSGWSSKACLILCREGLLRVFWIICSGAFSWKKGIHLFLVSISEGKLCTCAHG